jgi:uncharacterized protein YdiU (UPF0061 family)
MFTLENSYSKLTEKFYQPATPYGASDPQLIIFNQQLADSLGLTKTLPVQDKKFLANVFSGNQILPHSHPVALAYAGHQFGHFVPSLGDGRAMLLGEILTPDQKRFDVQLKGSGQTVFSRRGDGKSALGPVIREYLISEAMFNLRIPTTRSLAAVATGDMVMREELLPGGIVTRVASSHLRIGTFEYFAARNDIASLQLLADYAIHRHYPELENDSNQSNKYLGFLAEVIKKQATLLAQWLGVGFIHGVMNTDNMTISGETIDFGPCAFMDYYNPDQVYSYIDRQGRYRYQNQISIAKWNLSQLANCLVVLVGQNSNEEQAIDQLNTLLSSMDNIFKVAYEKVMCAKLGLSYEKNSYHEIIDLWFKYLHEENLDFTSSFRNLSQLLEGNQSFYRDSILFEQFKSLWFSEIKIDQKEMFQVQKLLNSLNPLYIPRNHLVEKAIAYCLQGKYEYFYHYVELLKNPFTKQKVDQEFSLPPRPQEIVKNTFCGT